VAVLGDMLELGPEERAFHEEVGRQAAEAGVEVLVTVGPRALAMAGVFEGEAHPVADAAEAAALLPELVQGGDTVLVKGSRGVALEAVADSLRAAAVAG
jgi:UDP-N-acetylmuramoyl-tripeptide--D-alanyl-D-alanine ligase